ncbi:MAG: hypothetical protein V2A71_09415, partial [Candidatus Eisenbacteria bacterium]
MEKAGRLVSLAGLAVFSLSATTTIVGQEIGLSLMLLGLLALLIARGAPGKWRVSIELPVLALLLAWSIST